MQHAGEAPALSLLVPVYNVERYLRECLQSVQAQTFKDIEVICINDGSTDGSRPIIEEFLCDPRFRVIDKPNSGYGASMNCGLDAARGTYLAILESDDFVEPDALELLFAAAERTGADVAKANFMFYWSHPTQKDVLYEVVTPDMAGRTILPVEEPAIFRAKSSIWSGLYRTSFLRGNGIRFLETPGASYQDTSFNFKVWACAERVACLGEPLVHYRQDNEASSVNSPAKLGCVFGEYEEIDRFLEERPKKKRLFKSVEMTVRYNDYMWNYERLAPELRLEFLERMAEEFRRHIDEGAFSFDLIESWKQADLRAILDSPERFNALRWRYGRGRMGKALHYLFAGGVPMAREIIKQRFRG